MGIIVVSLPTKEHQIFGLEINDLHLLIYIGLTPARRWGALYHIPLGIFNCVTD